MKTLLLVATLLLSACASTKGPEDITTPQMDKPKIDARLLVECEKPSELVDNPRPTDILKQHGDDLKKFTDCADSKRQLIEAVKPMIGN